MSFKTFEQKADANYLFLQGKCNNKTHIMRAVLFALSHRIGVISTPMHEIPRKLRRQLEISELVYWHGLANVERLLEVHRTTIQRWCNGKIDVPVSAIIALRALKGDFPHMEAKDWVGWTFGRDGKLYEPNGYAHTSGQIAATYLRYQLMAALQVQVRELEAKLQAAGVRTAVVVPANETPLYELPDRAANRFPYTDKRRRKRA